MSRRVAIVGASGQLGTDLRRVWPAETPGDEVVAFSHAEIQVEDLESVRAALQRVRPDLVINTSAYHRVDLVEDTPHPAFAVNGVGPRHLALVCAELAATLVHFSTDYVFAGEASHPYVEDDMVNPISVYGASKVAGEMLVRLTWPRHFIIRSCGLYGAAGSAGKGGNFVETMLRLAADGAPIRVVDDQRLTPTATLPLAKQIVALTRTEAYGTYHATCQGDCTWYEFAVEIFRAAGLRPQLDPQSTAEAGSRARRPRYSVLDNRNLRRLGIDEMPHWREALALYLAERGQPAHSR